MIAKVDFSQSVAKLWNKYLLRPRGNEKEKNRGGGGAPVPKAKESQRYEKKEDKNRSVVDQKEHRKEWKRPADPPSRDGYPNKEKDRRERSRDRKRDDPRSRGERDSAARRSRSRDRSRERDSHRRRDRR